MKKSIYNFSGRQIIFWGFLCVCLLSGISIFLTYKTQAESKSDKTAATENSHAFMTFSAGQVSSADVIVGERVSPWMKLQTGKPLDTTFYGNDEAIAAMRNNLLSPLSQVSTDFNSDGYADLVSGFRNSSGGGLIAIHIADAEAFAPQNEQTLANLRNGIFPATFKKDALVLDIPTAPDFIFAGKFTENSNTDLVIASRGGRSIYLLPSDNKGGFGAAREIAVRGEITALASENLGLNDAYSGIIVAVTDGKDSKLLIFNGRSELQEIVPRIVKTGGRIDSMILTNSSAAFPSMDLFALADGRVLTVSGIGKSKGEVNRIELPFRTIDFAVGEFIRDRQGKSEIAVLSDGGTVSYLTRGALDTRPFTNAEMIEFFSREGRGRSSFTNNQTENDFAESWQISEEHSLGVFLSGSESFPRLLQKARITANETDDLMIINPQSKQIEILFKEPNREESRTTFTGETKMQTVNVAGNTSAVLPMRLNVMGQQGFVILNEGSLEPTAVMTAPNATFTVTTTTDENNGCGAGAGCSVREAVISANTTGGADMIMFGSNGNHQLTIAGINENAAASGDLDIRDGVTIVGNGAANTIIQSGTTNANGIDKVFSVNPLFTTPFATSFSNLTVRFGRNPSPITGDGYGGAIDWEASGTGTLSIAGSTLDNNRTTDGPGGGVVATNTPGGAGAMTISNTIISNNITASPTGAANGGGIFVGFNTPFSLTSVTVNANSVTSANTEGGGIFAFSHTGISAFTGITVTNNSTTLDGGGIATQRGLSIVAPIIISNNSAGRNGGGLYMNVFNTSVTMNKATMVGNNAAGSGGAIALGSQTSGNVLNMSFSRIVGNTGGGFTGLVTTGGTANVENNWWGCNTGPSAAPCNTAGSSGGGSVDFNPWLRYTHTASPSSIVVGQSTTLTVSFLTNSAGTAIAASNLDVLIGLPVTFNTPVRGTISGSPTTIQANGTATATFTATSVGAGSANAVVDNGTATANITIGQATTTTTITSDNPDPSVVGQSITVTYTVVGQFGGTPTGNVTVSDGVNSCTGTVATGQCTLSLTTAGTRTLTATYVGDANFSGSSDTEPHVVNKADTTTTITSQSATTTTVGQSFTVFYTVTVNSPGAGTPTGNVTVSDGVDSCTGTVAAGQCTITLNTVGIRTLTATYAGNTSFNGSTSAGVLHTVLPLTAASVSVTGRVQTQSGIGIPNARITLTYPNGSIFTTITNGFGYYNFEGVQAGEVYFFTIRHKQYQFTPQAVTILDEIRDLNFTALE